MCGRFALYADESEIVSHFHLSAGFSMRPRFNIAPTQIIPVVNHLNSPINFFRWGFIPAWDKSSSDKMPSGYINARVESVDEKPAFKSAFASKRCLIPASGYFEWRTLARRKQPYFIFHKDQPLLGLAGIWSNWKDPMGENHSTCAILTMDAPECLKPLHERSPVIIQKEFYADWLSLKGLTSEKAQSLFLRFQPENVGVRAVSPRMSRPDFDGPECILAL